MKNDSHLTAGYGEITARCIRLSVPGMAHFAATGPAGERCSGCAFFGYWRQRRNRAGNVIQTTFREKACGKYWQLMGQHGPEISGDPEACRHFQTRERDGR